ncbi:MAG: IS1 family transposase [Terriglobales bacterium]
MSAAELAKAIHCLCEGNSIRSTCRTAGWPQNTPAKPLTDLGEACWRHHDEHARGPKARRVQCDEIWPFIGARKENATGERRRDGEGDARVRLALEADTKLCVPYPVAGRDGGAPLGSMQDAAGRLRSRVPSRPPMATSPTRRRSKAHSAWTSISPPCANYGAVNGEDARRRGPAACVGCDMKAMTGKPDPAHARGSLVGRQNPTMRTSTRRFTRLTGAFSKQLENHAHAVAVYFVPYNYCRVRPGLRATPAMGSGLATHVWRPEELAGLLDGNAVAAA